MSPEALSGAEQPSAVVLVVDDEPDVESLIVQKFRGAIRAGTHRFLFARDGQQALELLAEHPECSSARARASPR